MATSFLEIYKLNSKIKKDEKIKNLPTNLQYETYFDYLTYAISYFVDDCYKDLNKLVPFQQQEYYFQGDGIDNQFVLNPTPPSNCLFYVGVRETEDDDYSTNYIGNFNESTNILTITPTPPLDFEVYVGGYIIGEFLEDLNFKEKIILSESLCVPWDEEKLHKQTLLDQMVYGGSTKMYSQAEHIKNVNEVSKSQYYQIVKGMINEYTFKQSPDNLTGLGGGLSK